MPICVAGQPVVLDKEGEWKVLDKDGGLKPLEMVPHDAIRHFGSQLVFNKSKEPKTAQQRRFEELMAYSASHAASNVDFLKDPDPPVPAGECRYCLKVDDHITQLCPYKDDVPKNAILGKGCTVVCKVCRCRFRDSCCAKCGNTRGCAILMDCRICGKPYDHWSDTCSKRNLNSPVTCDPYTGSFSFKVCPPKE